MVLVGIEIGILTKQTDCRAHPATDKVDGYPPKKGDDSFGDKYQDLQISTMTYDIYIITHNGLHKPRCGLLWGSASYDEESCRDYDQGYDSRIGSGIRAFASVYHGGNDY